ncbi:MAG: 30S ribosomal protein S20 [Christensenellaceae bacterium]|nr:30S ribosomal protein S20 [Christensenellaceae bacterium]
MANIKSQKKRILISAEENASNVSKRTRVKHSIKKFENAIVSKDTALAATLLPETISIIDRAQSDGVYKANTASRKVSRLSKLLSDLKKAESL